jgi:hypothetical protein
LQEFNRKWYDDRLRATIYREGRRKHFDQVAARATAQESPMTRKRREKGMEPAAQTPTAAAARVAASVRRSSIAERISVTAV